MNNAVRYWQLVRLTSSGQCQVQVLPQVQTWIQSTLAPLITESETSARELQGVLVARWQLGQGDSDVALLSLRCFVTHYIRNVCMRLATLFGETYGFTVTELCLLVLDDDGQARPSYRPFTMEILATYDPAKAALGTWSTRLTNHHPLLNQALLEKGLYRASDWAILNDTSPEQVQRILGQYHLCSPYEVTQAVALLERYQQVYRCDRIAQRQAGQTGRCPAPTPDQLRAIHPEVSTQEVLRRLRQLADQLRQYRIHVRGGHPQTYQREEFNWEQIADSNPADPLDLADDQEEFLQTYRQAMVNSLEGAIAQVVQAKVDRLQSRQPAQARAYVQGLHLFHCQGRSLGKLAADIGLTSQVQATRLLDLKRLRAEVRYHMIPSLQAEVRQQAQGYISAERLHALDQTLETLLTEAVDTLMAAAAAEAQIPKGRTAKSLFAQRLCSTLQRFLPSTE